ncbi:MAG TPA: RloB family protein [Drouetiella sp.]|jgi:RloB-like protein
MASRKRRHFSRPLGERRYRKLFLVAVEGSKTEPQYFAMMNTGNAVVRVECIPGEEATSPPQVLERLKARIKKNSLRKTDEAWLVVDKDDWTEEQLVPLFAWSQENPQNGFALSNPKFEYWLLLHFEDATVTSSRQCSEKLERYLSNYDKGIDARKFTDERIRAAIARAKTRDSPPCTDWPRTFGTTVYRLVERILEARRGD